MKQVEPLFFLARSGQECANGPPDLVEVDVFCAKEGFPLGFAGRTACVAHLFRFGDPADRELVKPNSFAFVKEKRPVVRAPSCRERPVLPDRLIA